MSTLTTGVVTPTVVAQTVNALATASGVQQVQTQNITMANTFAGANLQFSNLGIHLMLAEVINFRQQLTVRPEFQSQSGWTDSLNTYMSAQLNDVIGTLNSITYVKPSAAVTGGAAVGLTAGGTVAQTGAQATANATTNAANGSTVTPETVVMPSSYKHTVVWNLNGQCPDIPQLSPATMPNAFGRAFITLLDRLFVELTRLDSRHQPYYITQYESAMMMGLINQMFTIVTQQGGSANQVATPTGTLPSQEIQTFQG